MKNATSTALLIALMIGCNPPDELVDAASRPDATLPDAGTNDEDGCTTTLVYRDQDGDGAGDPAVTMSACEVADGWVTVAGDCDDASADVAPSIVEVCDATDQDCDGTVDEGFDCIPGADVACTTSCGSTGVGACSSACAPPEVSDCAPPAEVCNYADDDCDGIVDPGMRATLARRTYAGPATTEVEVVPRSDGGYVVAYLAPGAAGVSVIHLQRVDADGAAEGTGRDLGSSVWAFDIDSDAGRLVLAWREDMGSFSTGALQVAGLDEADLEVTVGPTTLSTMASQAFGGDVGLAINPTSGRTVIVASIDSNLRSFAVNTGDLSGMTGPNPLPNSVSTAWSVSQGPSGGFIYVSVGGWNRGRIDLLDPDGAPTFVAGSLMIPSGYIVSPTVRWIESGVGAVAFSSHYAAGDARNEVSLTLIDDTGSAIDSVRVADGGTPRYLNTALRAVDLAYAGGSWWVAYLAGATGDTALGLREVTPTPSGFDVRTHHVEASCDSSGTCTDLLDDNQSVSVTANGSLLVGASRLSAGPRTVLFGCP